MPSRITPDRAPAPARLARLPVLLIALLAAPVLVLNGCGGESPTNQSPTVAAIHVTPTAGLVAGTGDTLQFEARAVDARGNPLSGVPITWSIGDAGVATVSSSGLVTAVAAGTTQVRAASGGIQGSGTVENYSPSAVPACQAGDTCFGRNDYAEYQPGTLPIIISAPHGGEKRPDEIPDRTSGVTGSDRNTRELARAIADALEVATGQRPHLVLSRLLRLKLDPNREIVEAAQGSRAAEVAWAEYHGFIDAASASIEANLGPGLYLDIHGHGHDIDRVEMGYLLAGSDLEMSDAVLNGQVYVDKSSVRVLAETLEIPFSQLIRGPASLGSMLMARGYRSVPSLGDPDPGGEAYFTGGYSTVRHGSRDGGSVSGIQLEHHFEGLRDTAANRSTYAGILAETLLTYMNEHF